MQNVLAILLAGGAGERLFPLGVNLVQEHVHGAPNGLLLSAALCVLHGACPLAPQRFSIVGGPQPPSLVAKRDTRGYAMAGLGNMQCQTTAAATAKDSVR